MGITSVGILSFSMTDRILGSGSRMALSDAACRAAKPGTKLRKLSDSGGLQLWVQPNGSRLWRLAYRFNGKQKLLSFGKYPFVSLAGARQGRDQAKKQLAAGTDPLPARNQQKLAQPQAGDSFKIVAAEYVEKLKREQRALATLAKKEWLLGFAYDTLDGVLGERVSPLVERERRETSLPVA